MLRSKQCRDKLKSMSRSATKQLIWPPTRQPIKQHSRCKRQSSRCFRLYTMIEEKWHTTFGLREVKTPNRTRHPKTLIYDGCRWMMRHQYKIWQLAIWPVTKQQPKRVRKESSRKNTLCCFQITPSSISPTMGRCSCCSQKRARTACQSPKQQSRKSHASTQIKYPTPKEVFTN